MAFFNHNLTGAVTKELLASGYGANVSSISLTNTHATADCVVDLYMEKKLTTGKTFDASYGKFYILKGISIPAGVSLTHDFKFDNILFGLFIKLGASTSKLDVIIN